MLPQDQIFDPEDLEYDHKHHQEEGGAPKKRIKSEPKSTEVKMETEELAESTELIMKQEDNASSSNWDIDNPYLAATKLPLKNE